MKRMASNLLVASSLLLVFGSLAGIVHFVIYTATNDDAFETKEDKTQQNHISALPRPNRSWTSGSWDDASGHFSSLLDQARDQAPSTFAGRSVLVMGGSTSRDLAGDFFQMVLPSEKGKRVLNSWQVNQTQGWKLFPPTGKRTHNWHEMYEAAVMDPLTTEGWEFSRLSGETAGCHDCSSSYTNIDYLAAYQGGAGKSSNGITYEFTWKPEIFAPGADTTGFQQRYCKNQYDVIHIGRGLHDAAFKKEEELTPEALRDRFIQMSKLIECFPGSTLIVLRTPYVSTIKRKRDESVPVNTITAVLRELVALGIFGKDRSILIDGNLITSAEGHPVPFDGHHYQSNIARTYWSMVTMAAREFFGLDGREIPEISNGQWQGCGLGTAAQDS